MAWQLKASFTWYNGIQYMHMYKKTDNTYEMNPNKLEPMQINISNAPSAW